MATSLSRNRGAIVLFLLFFGIKASGQSISNYVVSGSAGSYNQIGGTFPSGSGSTTGDNRTFSNIPIGFDFWYMGERHTAVSASIKGWFTFGSTIGGSVPTNNLVSGGTRPVIAPLWDDIARIPGILTIIVPGTFSYTNSGTAPNRTLTLQWHLMRWDLNAPIFATIGGDVISFQAVISESSGNVEFIYRPESRPVNNGSASAGITATATGSGNYISLNSISSTSTTPPFSTTSETATINIKPAAVRSVVFAPEKVNAPTNLTFTEVGTSAIRLNWTDNSSNELGFVVYRSTDNVNFTYLGQTAANVTTFNNTALTTNTIYYYRVYAFRESLSNVVSGSQVANCQAFSLAAIPTGNIVANYKFSGNANDYYGLNNGTMQGSPTATINRFGITNSAYQFNGSTQYVSTTTSFVNPAVFTVSIWFRATVAGGKLIGFGSLQTGFSTSADRHIYMANDGKVYFGAKPGGIFRTINSATSYADGSWHMATATMSSAGIVLYVDGAQVASDATVTSGENYTGRWRIAYDNIDGWANTPTNRYFTGDLDDAYIYSRALSAAEVLALYNSGDGVTNNGPVCAGSTLTLAANALSDATYSWTGPNGFTSALQSPTLVYADAAKGTYTVTVTRNGCSAAASTLVSSMGEGRWTGNVDSNWSTANNWCNGVVPTSAVNVSIPTANVANNPTLSAVGSSNNISVESGRILTIANGGNLQVAGAVTNAGSIVATAGKVTFNGTSAQVIPANVFSTNTIKDLELNNAAGVTLNSALRLTGILTATVGTFNANGNLTLASSATSTAGVATIPVGASIIGQVKVERFIQGGAKDLYRGYRMLSSPIYDNTTSFVNANIEGNRSTKFSQLIDDMIITGTGGAVNGFDQTSSNPAGAWTHNLGYVGIPNINTSVNTGKGMYLFFRGNRDNFPLKTNSPYVDPENVVMDFDGILNQQDISVTLNYSATLGGYNLLGNPYASTIDWDSANWGADKVNINNSIWVWNPVKRSYATYVNGLGSLDGSRYIASGQSFFVQALAPGSIKFKENIKMANQQPPVLLMSAPSRQTDFSLDVATSRISQVKSVIRMLMKPIASFGEDETVIAFSEDSHLEYTTAEDALHLNGEIVNIASIVGTRRLAINFLPPSAESVYIDLLVNAATTGNYMFSFNLDEYFQGHSLMLKDNLLQKNIPILPSSIYSFYIDKTNAETFADGRFSILVEPPVVLPIGLLSFTAKKISSGVQLNWNTEDAISNKIFKLLRAGDNGVYTMLGSVSAAAVTKGYSFIDTAPLPGYNYYKLVGVTADHTEIETKPVFVNFTIENHKNVVVYPNPVAKDFTVQVDGLLEEKYRLRLFDVTGGELATYSVVKRQLSEGYKVEVSNLNLGIFVLKIEEVVTGKLVVVEKLIKKELD